MITRWDLTYLMIKRLLKLREPIEEISLLSAEIHISLAIWSSSEDIFSVFEMPYFVTVMLQNECLTPGAFLKARFHYERGIEHSLFLLLIFPSLKLKRALSKAKKSIKQTKNNLFHARSGNGPQKSSEHLNKSCRKEKQDSHKKLSLQ